MLRYFDDDLYNALDHMDNVWRTKMDKTKIEEGVRLMLEGIGEDINREGLLDTPKRISAMCEEIFAGIGCDAKEHLCKTFAALGNDVVLEKDIQFYSVCEHHLLPFMGKAHIAYIPKDRVVGLSKLARTVDVYAKRPQIQEQMTRQIAQDIMENLKPLGVCVIVEAEHLCMSMRGVRKPGTTTMTYAALGEFKDNKELLDRVFMMIK